MVVVGGHLHGELAAGRQGARQSREQLVVLSTDCGRLSREA